MLSYYSDNGNKLYELYLFQKYQYQYVTPLNLFVFHSQQNTTARNSGYLPRHWMQNCHIIIYRLDIHVCQ